MCYSCPRTFGLPSLLKLLAWCRNAKFSDDPDYGTLAAYLAADIANADAADVRHAAMLDFDVERRFALCSRDNDASMAIVTSDTDIGKQRPIHA